MFVKVNGVPYEFSARKPLKGANDRPATIDGTPTMVRVIPSKNFGDNRLWIPGGRVLIPATVKLDGPLEIVTKDVPSGKYDREALRTRTETRKKVAPVVDAPNGAMEESAMAVEAETA